MWMTATVEDDSRTCSNGLELKRPLRVIRTLMGALLPNCLGANPHDGVDHRS